MKTTDFTDYARRLAHAYVYNRAAFLFAHHVIPDFTVLSYEAIRDVRMFKTMAEVKYGIHLDITEDTEDAIYDGIEQGWNEYICSDTSSIKLCSGTSIRERLSSEYKLSEVGKGAYFLSRGNVSRILVLPETTSNLALTLVQIDTMADIIRDSK